jgi:hypothetical protein
MAAAQLAPFRFGTRRRRAPLVTFNYDGTAILQRPAPFKIPNVGFLSRLFFVVRGKVAYTGGAGVFSKYGWADLFNRIQVNANIGSAGIIDVSGRGAAAVSSSLFPNSVKGDPPNLAAADTGTIKYQFALPISANDGRNFDMGALGLQDPQIQVTLSVIFNPVTSLIATATTGGTTSLTIEVWEEYWEIPDPRVFALPVRLLCRTLEETQGGLVAGNNIYQMPRLGTLLWYGGIGAIQGVTPFTDVILTDFLIKFNKTDTIEEYDGNLFSLLDATIDADWNPGDWPGVYSAAAPVGAPQGLVGPRTMLPGMYVSDLWHAEGARAQGDLRDAIDTELLTTTEFIYQLGNGYAPNAADTIQHVRRVAQVLA